MYVFSMLVVYAVFIYGWVMNIIALVAHAGPVASWTAIEVARVVGIFVIPLGAVLGYV